MWTRILTSIGSGSILVFTAFAAPIDALAMQDCCDPRWSAMPQGEVSAIAVFDLLAVNWPDPTKPTIYAAGTFGPSPNTSLAIVGSTGCASVDGAPSGWARKMIVFDDGNGTALFLAVTMPMSNGQNVSRVARWDGSNWSWLGGDFTGPSGYASSFGDMEVFDDGTGPALYVGGQIASIGGLPFNNLAKWNGRAWVDVGGGITGNQGATFVHALHVHDVNGNARLFVAGNFTHGGVVFSHDIIAWDGISWHSGPVTPWPAVTNVVSLCGDDGRSLLCLSRADYMTNQPRIATWDGESLSMLGTIPAAWANAHVICDGVGHGLYSSGSPGRLLRWNGRSWSFLPGGPTGSSDALEPYIDCILPMDGLSGPGARPVFLVGGDFVYVNGVFSRGLARLIGSPTTPIATDLNSDCCVNGMDLALLITNWGPCADVTCIGDVNGDGVVNVTDLLALISQWG